MFANKQKISKAGFSLPELLVVIAIIGTLSAIVVSGVSSARSTGRDIKRVADLEAIETGLQMYHDKFGTYLVAGTGWSGGGNGWLGYEDGGTYPMAVTRGLYNQGFLPVAVLDDPKPGIYGGYMIYLCDSNQSYSLSATKENPTARDIADIKKLCNGSTNFPGNSIDGTYNKNVGVGNKIY